MNELSVCLHCLSLSASLVPCYRPFGARLCNSAVHATNLDTLQDLTVLNAAMFSCSHVRFCFQVFFGFVFTFFFLFLFLSEFLS